MKKIISICFTILMLYIPATSYAQLNIGIKFNWTANKFIFKNVQQNHTYYNSTNALPTYPDGAGASAGIVANYKLNHRFSLQSELIYNSEKFDFIRGVLYTSLLGEPSGAYNFFTTHLKYLELPIMGKISFGNAVTFDILAGGFVGYLVAGKSASDYGTLHLAEDTLTDNGTYAQQKAIPYPARDAHSDFTRFNAGVLLGCGVTMRDRIVIEVRVNRGLINIQKTDSSKFNTLQSQLTVAWYIFRQKKKE